MPLVTSPPVLREPKPNASQYDAALLKVASSQFACGEAVLHDLK